MPSKKVIWLPIRIVIIFLASTLALYFISPNRWPTNNPFVLVLYNALVFSSILLGFYHGKKKYNIEFNSENYIVVQPHSDLLKRYINKLLILNVVFIYPRFILRIGKGFMSIEEIAQLVVVGFFSPEAAYADKSINVALEFQTFSNPIVFIAFIISPLLFLTIPISIFLWNDLKRSQRIMLSIIILSDILTYLAIGTNKGIFDYIIMLPFIIYARHHSINKINNRGRLSRWSVVTLVIFAALAFSYFTKNIIGRTGDQFGYNSVTKKNPDPNAPLLKILPEWLEDGYISLDSYLTQGYYALDKCFSLDFKACYGVGHSEMLTAITEKYLGKGTIRERTYQYRLQMATGYPQYQKWHTFYVSMANDLSFWGVLPFLFLLSSLFAKVWLDVLLRQNLFAVGLFPLFLVMYFYLGANNQVLGFGGQSFIFWVLLAFFLQTRRKTLFYEVSHIDET